MHGWERWLLPVALATAGAGHLVPAVPAHTGGTTGFAVIEVRGATVRYSLTLTAEGLPPDIGSDLRGAAGGDTASQQRVLGLLGEKVTVHGDGRPCRVTSGRLEPSAFTSATVTLALTLTCPQPPQTLQIQDDVFDVLGSEHHTLAKVESSGQTQQAAFTPDSRVARFQFDAPSGGDGARRSFVRLGVEHILTGYDHLLFLLALLARGGGLWSLFKIVTAFTVAHSVTLALAVLGLVSIPARVVEPAIAASIVWVALENVLLRDAPSQRWLVSFCFGLIHGLGFASALGPLALPAWNLALALLGFNLGVETGQAMVVIAVLPLLLWARRHPWEPRVMQATSLALAGLGLIWVIQRLFFV